MLRRVAHKLLLPIVLVIGFSANLLAEVPEAAAPEQHASVSASEAGEAKSEGKEAAEEGFNPGKVIIEHISDSHEWHLFSFKKTDGSEFDAVLALPVILFSPSKGLSIFSFARFEHGHAEYKGFKEEEGVISATDGSPVYDISLTRNVIQMMIGVALMLLIFLSVARNFKKYGTKAPRGLHSVVEVLVMFIRDQVAKPLLGEKANKYLPYLLTLFFFIWINNLLGLFPGAANVTGNIAVTMTLAAFTFILMMVGSSRNYWSHMASPPGVPGAVLPILVPIEFISNLVVKPFALMIRLFANMLAGHLIVLSFLMLIFIFSAMNIFAGLGASIFSVAFAIFIYLLELLVCALQAYIFTILTALFISEAIATGGHDHDHKESHH
ncbi:MAG: F0F1 ATP synthase subunit A [Chitinophagaceae bacterium]|nr:F0F1 ATP synthase subunit A [Chitinophagaceae bacterium]